jgi:uncharacterized membrane protein YcaP (DUF421 family)
MELLQVALSALGSILTLFLLAKLVGHRQIAQLDVFDYITGITIGSIAAEMAIHPEESPAALLAMVLYALATVGISLVTNKFGRSRRVLNGTPTVLLDRGKLYRENLKKAKLDLSEFLLLCRQAGYFDLADIQTAVFEFNGGLSILPVAKRRPATPEDLALAVPQASIPVELILDGHVVQQNLRRLGLDETWLKRALQEQRIGRVEEVFLAVCDEQHQLTVYPMD